MKIEIDDTVLIDSIVKKVVEQLEPLIKQDSNANQIMTVDEIANYLKVKTSWVYEKIHTREIPFKKVGKFPRFLRKDIELWLINPYHSNLSHYSLKKNGKGVNIN
jgi:excisionase family DNA binding protein